MNGFFRPSLLSINNYYYPRGGAESVFLEQNHMLEAKGWRVVPFSMHHPNNMSTPWSKFFVDEIEADAPYSTMEKLKRAPKVVYSREARQKLALLMDSVSFDVAHLHNIYHHISPSILSLLTDRGVPAVMTLHDLKLVCPAYKMLAHDGVCERCRGGNVFNVVRHRCIKGSLAMSALVYIEAKTHAVMDTYQTNIDRFIVPSRFFVDKLVSWGIPPEKLSYVPNFVDASRLHRASRPGDHFLYFGRIAPEKGIATLIRAAALSGSPVKIAGAGPDLDTSRRLAAELKADVEFLGHLSGAALHQAVRTARAVVLPSEWYENAPMSILESYALGVPVIGANIGGIPELIQAGETGHVFQSGSVEELAVLLGRYRAMTDSSITGMGTAARHHVERHYSAGNYHDGLINVYRELNVTC